MARQTRTRVRTCSSRPADPGVVKHLGGGSGAVGLGDRGVVEEGKDEALQVGVGEAGDIAAQLVPHLVDVEVGDGKIVGGVDLGFGGEAQLLQCHLELVLVARDLALCLDVAALDAGGDGVGEVLPHDGGHGAGLVGKCNGEELAAALAAVRAPGVRREQKRR